MRMLMACALLAGCSKSDTIPLERDDSQGLLGTGRLNPFPSVHAMTEDGHVDVPLGELPVLPTRLPVERMAWRKGFSAAQPIVVEIDDYDTDALPSWRDPTPGEGGVLLADLTDGTWLPVMAEADAHPDAEQPVLIIRPGRAIPDGHTVAVVITKDVMDRPQRYDDLVDGTPPDDFAWAASRYDSLLNGLSSMGVSRDDVALAWDFPVDVGTTPLVTGIPQVEVQGGYEVLLEKNADEGDSVGTSTFRYIEGIFDVQTFLDEEDGLLALDESTGEISPQGVDFTRFYASIPESVANANKGTVPILFYGHGLFSRPDVDLDQPGFETMVNRLSEELGMIVLAARWRGLGYDDSGYALAVANDFGQFPILSDRMIQGQLEYRALVDLARDTKFLEDDVFRGRSGQVLADPDQMYFYGISMGSIVGGVFLAQDPGIESAVLHVGGGAWSTMLDRSSNWSAFEPLLADAVPDPNMRQFLYSIGQLWWDPVDPIAYGPELSKQTLLLQQSMGDDSVPNIATTMLARSIELPALTPSVDTPWGFEEAKADLPKGSRAYVQLDPMRGQPTDQNRPPNPTGAHTATLNWDGVHYQAAAFLTPGSEGEVLHLCGKSACTAQNRGEAP